MFDSLIIKEENHESERVRGFLLRRSDCLSQCKAKTAPKQLVPINKNTAQVRINKEIQALRCKVPIYLVQLFP